jgi:hypothetical protein
MLWGNGGGGVMSPVLMAFLPILASVVLGWVVNMGLTGWLASRKGRDGGLWVVAALFLGPIAFLIVLVAPRKPEKPGGPAAALAPVQRVRLHGDTVLELDLAEGIAVMPGELLPRVDGRPAFKVQRSALWRWFDGRPMADAERTQLLAEVPAVGRHEGWNLMLDAEDTR